MLLFCVCWLLVEIGKMHEKNQKENKKLLGQVLATLQQILAELQKQNNPNDEDDTPTND